jgi:hypothetical protein
MTVTLTREEAQQVLDDLEALMAYIQGIDKGIVLKAQSIETLRARLSAPEPNIVQDAIVYGTGITKDGKRIDPDSIYKEPEPPCKTGSQCIGGKCPQCVVSEPVAWMNEGDIGKTDWKVWAHGKPTATMPLYAAPPQREWQGLTDEEIEAGFMANTCCDDLVVYEHVASVIEAKLREKNT